MISISPLVLPASRALPNIDRQSPQGTNSSSPHSNISRSHSEQQRLSSQGVNPLTFVPMGPDSRSSSPKSHGPTDNSRSPMHEMPSYLPPRPPSRLGTFPFDRSPSFQHSQHPQHHQSPNREDTETRQDYYDVEGGETRHGESDLLRALRETLLESRRQTDALNEALILARRETAELQQRCEELKALAEELRIPQDLTNQSVTNSQIATSSNPAPNPHAQSQIQRNPNADPAFDQSRATHSPSSSTERGAESPPMDVMELMDEYELRENFRALLTALSLPFNVPELHQTVSLMSSLPQLPSKTRASPKSVSDIIRALEFVRFVDELVWKRSNPQYAHRAPSDNLGIFSEANIRGLEDRVELWERAVRSPKKKK
ncbi:hypothetical protein FRC03_000212 [Tulasnella sp. 419]|nr:hypothetical protein FRC03_000212 [Tulasnella sp. 419]